MIIVEGPDGGGKTTLIQRIQEDFGIELGPKASDSLDGPVDNLPKWVDRDLFNWGYSPLRVYDRHPLISEPIYGTIVRGFIDEKFTTQWLRNRLNLLRSMSLLIWCIPPYVEVSGNVFTDEQIQMKGVSDNIQEIWMLYSMHASMWTGPGIVYDYTQQNRAPRDTQLANLIRRHVISWRYFQ